MMARSPRNVHTGRTLTSYVRLFDYGIICVCGRIIRCLSGRAHRIIEASISTRRITAGPRCSAVMATKRACIIRAIRFAAVLSNYADNGPTIIDASACYCWTLKRVPDLFPSGRNGRRFPCRPDIRIDRPTSAVDEGVRSARTRPCNRIRFTAKTVVRA